MKLMDGIAAFFTTAFDKLFAFFGLIKRGFEHVVNNRIAMMSLLLGTVKVFYDKTILVLNEVLAGFQGAGGVSDPDSVGGLNSLLEFANCIFPISETFQVFVLLLELWLVVFVIRLKLRFLPRILR